MIPRPPRSTSTDTPLPSTTRFRSTGLAHAVEVVFPVFRRRGVRAPEGVLLNGTPIPIGAFDAMRSHLDEGAADADRLRQYVVENLAGDAAGGDAHGGLARRGAAAAAVVADAVLFPVGIVGVAGAKLVGDIAVVLGALVLVLDDK